MSRKIQLVFRGEWVSLSLADSHKVLCFPRDHLCSGLIFEESIHCSVSIEVDGQLFSPDWGKVTYYTKEFVVPKEWQSTKRLAWNHCINKWQDADWACEIEVEGEFDERLLRYNALHPVSVREREKVYHYNRPILTTINYNGTDYSLTPIIRHKHTEWLMKRISLTEIVKNHPYLCGK